MKSTIFEETYLELVKNDRRQRLDQLIDKYTSKSVSEKADIEELLNIALMDEFLAEFNYYASYNLSKTDGKTDYDPEFQQHEEEERDHRKEITNRLRELGYKVPKTGIQDFLILNSNGSSWKQEHSENSNDILLNRYNEELSAIKFYGLIFAVLKRLPLEERDTTTEMMIKKIKADEEEHAKDLKDLLVEHKILPTVLNNDNKNVGEENE